MKSTLYYYPGTPPSGSADPLRRAMQVRSVLRTGWGPRGDSGSARGRVRATQPANFLSASLCTSDQSAREETYTQALLFFFIHRYLPCILLQPHAEIFP